MGDWGAIAGFLPGSATAVSACIGPLQINVIFKTELHFRNRNLEISTAPKRLTIENHFNYSHALSRKKIDKQVGSISIHCQNPKESGRQTAYNYGGLYLEWKQ